MSCKIIGFSGLVWKNEKLNRDEPSCKFVCALVYSRFHSNQNEAPQELLAERGSKYKRFSLPRNHRDGGDKGK